MKWEYNRCRVARNEGYPNPMDDAWMFEFLNDTLGQDGWELVAIEDGIAYFKRPSTILKKIKRFLFKSKWEDTRALWRKYMEEAVAE
jgi:hypothetical protein